jgi:hypothetical protein
VHDLPRVMRVPGFFHRKEPVPFRSRLVEVHDHGAYTIDQVVAELPPLEEKTKPAGNGQATNGQDTKPIKHDTRAKTPLGRLNQTALENLKAWVPVLFPSATERPEEKGWRVSSASLGRDLEEDISFHPSGIKDFGLADQGDLKEGKRTPVEIVQVWKTDGDRAAAINLLCDILGIEDRPCAIDLEDFRAYMPQHTYIYLPTREPWPASSVNARIPPVTLTNAQGEPILNDDNEPIKIKANLWLDQNQAVEQMTWAPGLPMLIADRVVDTGGWIAKDGVTIFNLYRPPTIVHGDASKATPWVEHVHRVYPDGAEHLIRYFAHRVQRPQEKINHGLVLGGAPGIGKDTLLEPVKQAIGPWNMHEVSPQQVLGRFNGFVKSVILRVSEARDMGELNRFALYEHMKGYLAAPPDVHRCDEKHLREHSVFNVLGVVITSNRKDSFYLPADDRRHFVAWTEITKEDFTDEYWREVWGWYEAGGYGHVAAYLATLDLSSFNPKAPPPKTAVFWEIVGINRSPEDSEFADAIEKLGNPNAVTIDMIRTEADFRFLDYLDDRRNSRKIPHRMGACGYVEVHCKDRQDGYWKIGGKRQAVYVKVELSERDRQVAALELVRNPPETRPGWNA